MSLIEEEFDCKNLEKMQCISPISLKDPRKKRGSLRLTVPCGKCGACRHNRRVEWSFRLKEEYKNSLNGWFVTLTYNENNLRINECGFPTLVKKDIQLFNKRIRKENDKHWSEKTRFYIVGEYGTKTERPHYHGLYFNLHSIVVNNLVNHWNHGTVKIGTITEASIHYMTKYHVNKRVIEDDGSERLPEFAMMSRNPGIGKSYVDKSGSWNLDNGNVYVMNNGYPQRMPRYYKEKIFSKQQLELFSEQAISDSDREYWMEYKRLYDLGYKDPDKEMELRFFNESKKVHDKAERGNTI